jgi:hypothetical protein
MKAYRHYYGWILAGLFIGLAVISFDFADSWYVKRMDNISTILLALLTATCVVFPYNILKSTRPQSNVFASFPTDEMEIHLSIKNIGNRPAYGVEVTFDPSLDTLAPAGAFKGVAGPTLKHPFMASSLDEHGRRLDSSRCAARLFSRGR